MVPVTGVSCFTLDPDFLILGPVAGFGRLDRTDVNCSGASSSCSRLVYIDRRLFAAPTGSLPAMWKDTYTETMGSWR